jgi:hypothetical protein
MHRFAIVCLLTVLIGSVSESIWAGDESLNYVSIGRGLDTCTLMTTTRDERYPQVIHWLAGYLTAYNRWQPETYDITGDPHASDWERWIQQYCMTNPTILIAQAAEAFVHAFYPSRLMQAPNEVRPPAPQTIPPTRWQAPRTRNAAASPLGIPASVVTPIQSSPRRELIRHVQERLQATGFSTGAIEGALGPQTRDALRWFQNAKGIRATGEFDETTLDALGVR